MTAYKKFEDIPPSTMVVTADIGGNLNLYPVCCLLHVSRQKTIFPVSYINYDQFKVTTLKERVVSTKKYKGMPFIGHAGPIWHVSHGKFQRGIRRSSKNHFKNCITIDLSIGEKNVNIKLMKKSMQITGIKSRDMAVEAFNVLKYNIESSQYMINYMNSKELEKSVTVKWIKDNLRGTNMYLSLIHI